jgi:hypothetical protein
LPGRFASGRARDRRIGERFANRAIASDDPLTPSAPDLRRTGVLRIRLGDDSFGGLVMADSKESPAKLELQLPGSMLADLATAASSRGRDVEALALEWLQDRLVHEQEKQEGLAKKVRRP